MKRTHPLDWLLLVAVGTVALMLCCIGQCCGEIVVVTSPGCFPCQRMKNYLGEFGDQDIRIIDTAYADDRDEARGYGVKAVPTTIVFRERREIARFVGYVPRWQMQQLCDLANRKASGYWTIRPRPLVNVSVLGVGACLHGWQWVWVSLEGA